MDIVIERSFDWMPLIAAGAALVGAVIGVFASGLLELWRRMLDGVSAARLIRMELVDNREQLSAVLTNLSGRPLRDDRWHQYEIVVAPLLTDDELAKLHKHMVFLPDALELMKPLGTGPAPGTLDNMRKRLGNWEAELQEDIQVLERTESAPRWRHAIHLLLGRRN